MSDLLSELLQAERAELGRLLAQVQAQEAAALADLQAALDQDRARVGELLADLRRQDAQLWQVLGLPQPQPTARKRPRGSGPAGFSKTIVECDLFPRETDKLHKNGERCE